MALTTATELAHELAQGPLLSAERRQELPRLQVAFPDVRGLARELVQRGWLTPYQVNQLVQGRGRELVLGPYVLLERLGEGGMGQVFKAQHTFLNRAVALKLISKAHLGTGAAAERFLLEMRLVAQLDHPHIVRAFDAGQAGDRYYLAMELIEGATLARLVQQRGPLPIGQACACVRQAALGLHHACARGLVHRDIKPSNLMLSTLPGSPPAVKVLDLGLARTQGGEATRDLTRTGTLMGTLDYLAPEQALDPRAVDVRADIYSLGCTFFFLLTGRPPFHGGTEAQKLLQHQQQEAPAVESLRPDVPPGVAAVLRRMLGKKPEQRFQTAVEIAAALQPFASWEGGAAAAPGTPGMAAAPSLISSQGGSAERGWTLMVDATRAPGGGSTAPGLPASILGPPPGPGSSFGLPLPPSLVTTAGAAPSLVAARAAAPEQGWTLLAEPASDAEVASAVVTAEENFIELSPVAPPGRRVPARLLVGVGAGLLTLALLGVGLAGLLRSSSSDAVAVRDGGKQGGNPQRPPPAVNPPDPEPVKGIRPLHIKPGQPMSLARTGDVAFPAYPSGFLAMVDRKDHDTFNVWDLTTMKQVASFSAVSGVDRPPVLSTDGRRLAGRAGDRVRVYDAEKSTVRTLPEAEGRADWIGFAGADRLVTLRSQGLGRGLDVWDLKANKLAFSLPLPGRGLGDTAAVSPDGRFLAVPGDGLVVVQELRADARTTLLALPKQKQPLPLIWKGLAFSADGAEVAGLFDELSVGLRVVSWDVKSGAMRVSHAVPAVSMQHAFFYPREHPALEWLPGRAGWLVCGLALIDYQTGNLRGTLPSADPHRQHPIRVLTGRYAVEVEDAVVRIITLPQPKGG